MSGKSPNFPVSNLNFSPLCGLEIHFSKPAGYQILEIWPNFQPAPPSWFNWLPPPSVGISTPHHPSTRPTNLSMASDMQSELLDIATVLAACDFLSDYSEEGALEETNRAHNSSPLKSTFQCRRQDVLDTVSNCLDMCC